MTGHDGNDNAHASCHCHQTHSIIAVRAFQRALITFTTLILGASELGAQPAPARMFEWAKGLFATSVHFDCVDPWQCYAAVTTVTRGGLTVHDVLDVTTGVGGPYLGEGSITSKPVIFSPCCRIYAFVVAPGIICLETREGFNQNPVVWTNRGHSEFQKSDLKVGDRALWGKSAEGELSRVSFTRGPASERGHALLLSRFRTDGSTLDKRIDLEKLRARNPVVFNELWWSDAFTFLSGRKLLFVRAAVGPYWATSDSLDLVKTDSTVAVVSYCLLDTDHPEKSSSGSADLVDVGAGSVPGTMGRAAECVKNSDGEIWYLFETQGYPDSVGIAGSRISHGTSLTLVPFVLEGDAVSIGSPSAPALTPAVRIDYPIHRLLCISGRDYVDSLRVIDIGESGEVFIEKL